MIFVKALIVISSDCTFTLYAVKWMKAFNTMKYFDVFWIHNLAGTFPVIPSGVPWYAFIVGINFNKNIKDIDGGIPWELWFFNQEEFSFVYILLQLFNSQLLSISFLMLITVLICGPFR